MNGFDLQPSSDPLLGWVLIPTVGAKALLTQLNPLITRPLKPYKNSSYCIEDPTSGPLLRELVIKKWLLWRGKPLHSDLFTPTHIDHWLSHTGSDWTLRCRVSIGKTQFFLDQATASPRGRWIIYENFFYPLSESIDRRALLLKTQVIDAERAEKWAREGSDYEGYAPLLIDESSIKKAAASQPWQATLQLVDHTLRRATLYFKQKTRHLMYEGKDSTYPLECESFISDLKEMGGHWSPDQQAWLWPCPEKGHEAIELLWEVGWSITGPEGEAILRLGELECQPLEMKGPYFQTTGRALLQVQVIDASQEDSPSCSTALATKNANPLHSLPLGPLSHHLQKQLKILPLNRGQLLLLPARLDGPLLALKAATPQGEGVLWQPWQAKLALDMPSSDLKDSGSYEKLQEWKKLLLISSSADQNPSDEGIELPLELRDYQRRGVQWLLQLYQMHLGGLLADEMGLGKTIQILAFLKALERRAPQEKPHPHLIVVPRSLLSQWQWQAHRFWGEGSAYIYHGTKRDSQMKNPLIRCWITTYQTLAGDLERLSHLLWGVAIFDESHTIRNPKSQGYLMAKALTARMKIAVTGTPIFNSLQDLGAQMQLVAPQIADPLALKPLKQGDLEVLAPLWLRRTKKEVASELPEKMEQIIWLDMDRAERELYERILQAELKVTSLGDDGKATPMQILEKILRLRQCCLYPGLIDPSLCHAGVKEEQLLLDLETLISEERSVLVFSQFSQVLRPLFEQSLSRGFPSLYIDGSTSSRESVLEAFEKAPFATLFMTLGTGSVGLNLTKASAVILLDPWWNESMENQAIDRVHRLGQVRGVDILRYIVKGSLEEAMLAIKREKNLNVQAWLDSAPSSSSSSPQSLHERPHEESLDRLLWNQLRAN